ncbi:Uncharacterised protein g2415 [Pycnogonum litorale]
MSDVFLGGSCNPTTWRTEIAIPVLNDHKISYFNPQVDNGWTPDLIEIEHRAKEEAEVLFFTIDNKTRSVVSIIECGYLAGCGRNLVVVLQKLEGTHEILKEKISAREFNDIKCGQSHLLDLTYRENIITFSSINSGLECVCKLIEGQTTIQNISDINNKSSAEDVPEDERIFRTIFKSFERKRSRVTVDDVYAIVQFISGERSRPNEITSGQVSRIVGESCRKSAVSSESCVGDATLSYEQFEKVFRCLHSPRKVENSRSRTTSLLHAVRKGIVDKLMKCFGLTFRPLKFSSKCCASRRCVSSTPDIATVTQFCSDFPSTKQVYLGGSCDKTDWRDKIVIPALNENGTTYFNPMNSCWSDELIPTELEIAQLCDIKLFCITDETRSLAAMTMAAYFIGKNQKVVLCVKDVVQNCQVAGEKLSVRAVQDYNRGRSYLRDIAERRNVPLYSEVEDAINFVVKLCK